MKKVFVTALLCVASLGYFSLSASHNPPAHVLLAADPAPPAPVVPPMPPMPPAPKPAPVVPPAPFIPPFVETALPQVTMPEAVKLKVGRTGRVNISYVGDDFRWWTDHLDGIDVFREYEPAAVDPNGDPNTKVVILRVGGDAGVYNLHSVVAGVVNNKAVLSKVGTTVITIGTPPPTPPGPGPGPFPPNPSNPFTAEFQAAYTADSDPLKADHVQVFASLFSSLGPVTADPKVTTTGTMLDVIKTAEQTLAKKAPPNNLPNGSIQTVSRMVAAELNKTLSADVPLTDASRTATATLFAQIAEALKGVK